MIEPARAGVGRPPGCDTKIMGYDHNWSEHPNDIANTPPGEDPETEYPTLLLRVVGRPLARAGRRTTATPATRSG